MSENKQTPDERLQLEFNRWAQDGEGPKMENHHLDITEKTLRRMDLQPGERVLDLGCGSGWATRLLARVVGEGFGDEVGPTVAEVSVPLDPADYPKDSTCNAFDAEQIIKAW